MWSKVEGSKSITLQFDKLWIIVSNSEENYFSIDFALLLALYQFLKPL